MKFDIDIRNISNKVDRTVCPLECAALTSRTHRSTVVSSPENQSSSSSSSSSFYPHFGQRTGANAGYFTFQEQIYPNFLLAWSDFKKEAVTEQLFRVRFYSKKKGFINRGYLYIFISQGYQGIPDCLALAKRVSIKKRSPIYDYVTFFGVSVRQIWEE